MTVSIKTAKYFQTRAAVRPLAGNLANAAACRQAVIIPARAESAYLPDTLCSLARNPAVDLADTMVVVVVNNSLPDQRRHEQSQPAPEVVARDNRRTLAWLRRAVRDSALNLAWIDASSAGRELPPGAGVGMARKIGGDSLLKHVLDSAPHLVDDLWLENFILQHLDADTLVEENYLRIVRESFGGTCSTGAPPVGAVLDFGHQPAATAALQQAMVEYERFLRAHVRGLAYAGSPYAFQTIGSAMASTALAYIRIGGMPGRRQAGEDFYFLQELAKYGRIVSVMETRVHPSARTSTRVPFGTGTRLQRAVEHEGAGIELYPPEVYTTLKVVLETVANNAPDDAALILRQMPEAARDFLEKQGFEQAWSGFQRQFSNTAERLKAFHCWFDALATLRLIHHLIRRKAEG